MSKGECVQNSYELMQNGTKQSLNIKKLKPQQAPLGKLTAGWGEVHELNGYSTHQKHGKRYQIRSTDVLAKLVHKLVHKFIEANRVLANEKKNFDPV